MLPAVAVHWEASPDALRPSAAAARALAEWAEARGLHLTEAPATALPAIVPDAGIAEAVEDELEHARDAIASLDTTGVEHALAKADALLHDHPELPQAAWLRAEVLRAYATRWRRLPPVDLARGTSAWAAAAALDGGRAPGLGEVATSTVTKPVAVTLAFPPGVDENAARTETRLDGMLVHGRALVAGPGEHQLTVAYEGALVWAGWVAFEAGTVVPVPLPRPNACSAPDLAQAHFAFGHAVAAGVACESWVFATEIPSSPGELSLASCEADRCAAPFRWRVGPLAPVLLPPPAGRWPAWATWALVGAGAVAITGATLAATGVFRPTHDEPVFTTGGLHTSSAPLQLHFGE